MGNLSGTIPFTEIYERVLSIARVDSPNNEDYAKGVVNDTYTRVIPRIDDWRPLERSGNLTMTAMYDTGTASVSAGDTTVTGTGTTWTASMTASSGYKIKFAGNDNIYEFEYTSATEAEITPALAGATDISGASYTIFKDEYTLESDFSRFLQNGSVYRMSGGRYVDTIHESPTWSTYRQEFVSTPLDPIRRIILNGRNSSNVFQVLVNPPPKTAKVYPYRYIKQVSPMTDYEVGTVAVTNGDTTVTGTGTYFTSNVSAGDYFRIDSTGRSSSSKWYEIASVDSNTQLTLSSEYGESTESNEAYTCSGAPTELPYDFHEFILYDTVLTIVSEASDTNTEVALSKRNDILKDIKKNYASRNTNIQIEVDDDGYR